MKILPQNAVAEISSLATAGSFSINVINAIIADKDVMVSPAQPGPVASETLRASIKGTAPVRSTPCPQRGSQRIQVRALPSLGGISPKVLPQNPPTAHTQLLLPPSAPEQLFSSPCVGRRVLEHPWAAGWDVPVVFQLCSLDVCAGKGFGLTWAYPLVLIAASFPGNTRKSLIFTFHCDFG